MTALVVNPFIKQQSDTAVQVVGMIFQTFWLGFRMCPQQVRVSNRAVSGRVAFHGESPHQLAYLYVDRNDTATARYRIIMRSDTGGKADFSGYATPNLISCLRDPRQLRRSRDGYNYDGVVFFCDEDNPNKNFGFSLCSPGDSTACLELEVVIVRLPD